MDRSTSEWTIRGATVFSMEPGWEPAVADVRIKDGVITEVGENLTVTGTVLEASGSFLLPGFVDTHRHVWQAALRGLGPDFTLKDYLRGIRLNIAGTYRPEDMYAGNFVGMVEATTSGVTTVLDHSHNVLSQAHAEQAVRGSIDSGIRSVFAFGLNDPPGDSNLLNSDRRLEAGARLAESDLFAEQDLVTFGVALPDAWKSGAGSVPRGVALARDLNAVISIHALSKRLRDRVSEVAVLDDLNLIGDDMVWVHMNQATDEELHRVLDAGGSVSVTPDTEAQMAMGAPVTGRVLRRGHLPSFGVDVVCSASGDFFQTLRSAMQFERLLAGMADLDRRGSWIDDVELKAKTVLEAATIGGARAVGLDHITGSITVGKRADLMVISPDRIDVLPAFDPVGAVATQCSSADVAWVFVDGRPVKADGRLVQEEKWRTVLSGTTEHLATQFDVRSPIPQPLAVLPE